MAVSGITLRFLECLDQLIDQGKVRSKRHFALSLDYHPQGISEMVAGRRDAPVDLIEKSVLTYRFNPVFLFTGHGNHFSNPVEDDGLRLRNLSVITDQQGEERIVHVPYPAQAGYGRLLDDPVFMTELPSYQLPDPQFRSGTYRSFEVAGTSMEPTFMPNDIVIAAFIEPRFWEQAIKSNQIYIIVTKKDVVIKRINNRIKEKKCIECCSDNRTFETYPIEVDEVQEVWKARVKLTSHIDMPATHIHTDAISEQLRAQQKMLENLHMKLSEVKIS